MYQVYKITNLINNKCYIGSSNDVERRFRQHKECAYNEKDHHYNYPLMKAFREYGINNFNFEVIYNASDSLDMINKERYYIENFNSIVPFGYNQTLHTDSPTLDPTIAKKMSDTKREKYGKRVCEINQNHEIINTYNSLAEAADKTGLNRFKISCVCNGSRHTTGNKIFRFLDDNDNIIEPEYIGNASKVNRITINSQSVEQLDKTSEEVLNVYESITLAALSVEGDSSSISKCCKGKQKTHKGYKWRYKKGD